MSALVPAVWHASRPSFLPLAPLCAGLGIALVEPRPSHLPIGLVLLAALLAHAAVNWLNEYDDFRSGLDLRTDRTPFSGGSGALLAIPAAAPWVLGAGVAALAMVAIIGLGFLWQRGMALALPGAVGIALVVAYTRWLTRHPWLCLLAPGLGFGPVMVLGSLLALGGTPGAGAWLVAIFVGLWVSELLLLNQLPDIEADRTVGRYHLAIARGRQAALRWGQGLLLATPLPLLVGMAAGLLPVTAGLALLPLPLVLGIARQLPRCQEADSLVKLLGVNVATLLASLALLLLGLML